MQTIQIRIPDDVLKEIDEIIEKGHFKSRSHLLREALTKYISEFNYIGTLPYIVGPFTPKEIELLKTDPLKSLVIPDSELKKINSTLKDFKV